MSFIVFLLRKITRYVFMDINDQNKSPIRLKNTVCRRVTQKILIRYGRFKKKFDSKREVVYADHHSKWRTCTHPFGASLPGWSKIVSIATMCAMLASHIFTFIAAGRFLAGRKRGRREAERVHVIRKKLYICVKNVCRHHCVCLQLGWNCCFFYYYNIHKIRQLCACPNNLL